MRTFVIRARKGSTKWQKIQENVGVRGHIEIVAHFIINAFYVANGFRETTEVYIVLDSSEDFPRTLYLSGSDGLSIGGFHEQAVLALLVKALKEAKNLQKEETLKIAPGLVIMGHGFEKLMGPLLETRSVYLLSPKGDNIRETVLAPDPVFVLSDHLAMPLKSIKGLKRRGLQTISLGKKMLFASQCVSILHYELDRI